MDGIRNINNEKPNAQASKQFWSNIWDNKKKYERNAQWINKSRAEKDNMKQNDINITEMIKEQVKKITIRKSSGPDGVKGYWMKKLIALLERTTKQMDRERISQNG